MGNFQDIHIEKDFWDDFILEAFEHIDEIETNTISLEQNPEDMDIIHTMFRAFHTLKGLSGFVEHILIQEIAHKTETLMDFCRKGEMKVSTEIVNAILKSADYIKNLCNNIEAFKDEAFVTNIEKHLEILEELSNVEFEVTPEALKTAEEKVEPETETVTQKESEKISEEEIQKDVEAFAKEISEIEEQKVEKEEESKKKSKTAKKDKPKKAKEEIEIVIQKEEPVQEEILEREIKVETEPKELVYAAKTVSKKEDSEDKAETKTLTPFQKEIIKKLQGKANPSSTENNSSAVKNTSANEEYMKVANYKIDNLVDIIGELIINQSLFEQYITYNYNNDRQLVTNMSGFLRTTRELQNLSMSLRMVSLKSTFQKLTRIARDTIQELKKDVEFITSGENTEIDRIVADKLLEPLVHMIKNAISHGIEEKVENRVKLGKSKKAKVELNAYSKRGKIFIQVKDDGRGINTEVVYKKALEKGLIDPGRNYSEAEIKEFIMLPGFSTAEVVDNISGRGVGMDVVKTQIMKNGGKVEIQSELNKGSVFTLEVPVNHAIMNGTIIDINDQQFVVPTVNIKEFLQPEKKQWIFTKQERTMIKVRENIIPIVPQSTFFRGIKEPDHVPLVMILELDQEMRAVPITNVINRQEVVVKPVGIELSHLEFISGMSILGTGKVSLILDVDYMFRKEIKK